jgi:hypothetical protein
MASLRAHVVPIGRTLRDEQTAPGRGKLVGAAIPLVPLQEAHRAPRLGRDGGRPEELRIER